MVAVVAAFAPLGVASRVARSRQNHRELAAGHLLHVIEGVLT